MSTTAPTPQPGAQQNPMLSLSMLDRDVTVTGWPLLPAKEAQNFIANAQAYVLPKGQTLYRVFGGTAGDKGAYWSPAPPAPGSTEAEWRRTNAIEYSWNTGEFVVSYTAEADIHLWKGGVESKPAQDMQKQMLPDYWLVGGGTQFFFANWLIPGFKPVPEGKTPWAGTTQAGAVAPEPLAATPADFDPADALAAQAFRVSALADALRASAEALRATPAGSEADAAALEGASANLISSANTILNNIGKDPKMVSAAVQSQLGLARNVGLGAGIGASETVDRQVTEIVRGAAVLSGRAKGL
ncbi:hypothetical protein A8B78_18160 [Jannaschia sp. EhC01]|nr:hypothetical protein A8B78_18160 [Jannaschia sp. EhC01]